MDKMLSAKRCTKDVGVICRVTVVIHQLISGGSVHVLAVWKHSTAAIDTGGNSQCPQVATKFRLSFVFFSIGTLLHSFCVIQKGFLCKRTTHGLHFKLKLKEKNG